MPAQFLTSPLLTRYGFRHAFFTRGGGASSGAYASLNFSYAVGDVEENVTENLQRAARSLEVQPARLYFLSQVHGNHVVELDRPRDFMTVLSTHGDALCSAHSDLACCVRTADCVPILLAERQSGAVAAVHAGWRGVVANVVANTLRTCRQSTQGSGDWVAAIGPHISVSAFEVSDDVAEQLREAAGTAGVVRRNLGPKPHVDLALAVRTQLEAEGVPPSHIEQVGGCTFGDPQHFFSYRRDGKASGRHLSGIVPRSDE